MNCCQKRARVIEISVKNERRPVAKPSKMCIVLRQRPLVGHMRFCLKVDAMSHEFVNVRRNGRLRERFGKSLDQRILLWDVFADDFPDDVEIDSYPNRLRADPSREIRVSQDGRIAHDVDAASEQGATMPDFLADCKRWSLGINGNRNR